MNCSSPKTITSTSPAAGGTGSNCTPTITLIPAGCNNTAGDAGQWVSVADYMAPCGITFSNFQHTTNNLPFDNSSIIATNPKNGQTHEIDGWTCSNNEMYKDTATLQSILSYLLG